MVPGAPLFPVALSLNTTSRDGSKFWAAGQYQSMAPPDPATWRNKTGAVVETWTNGWSTTFWEVVDITSSASSASSSSSASSTSSPSSGASDDQFTTLVFGNGGQQTGRGFHIEPPSTPPKDLPISTEGGWKIENAIELLDAPEEFFFDEVTRTLYLAHNGTGAPPATGWVVPRLKSLLRVVGKGESDPVKGVQIKGVGFRDAAYVRRQGHQETPRDTEKREEKSR